MKNKYYALFCHFFVLVFTAGCAGLNPPPNYKSEVSNWKTLTPPDSLQIKHSVFLIGDVGAPKDKPREPTLTLMRKQLEVADSNSTAIFLGDNVYSYGMPEPDAYDRKISERRLNTQLDILKDYRGEKYMIPGNHDWKQGLKGGWDAVKRQEEYVEEYLKDSAFVTGGDFFVPDNGCPGPFEVKIQDDIVIIALNSQWWLQNEDRPYGGNTGCNAVNETDVYVQIEDIIKKNQGSNILVVAHHPMFSDGVHGGYFTLLDHIFPVSIVHKWALIPLPIIGSIYPIARRFGGVSQDIFHPSYKAYIQNLLNIFEKYDNIIYAAGHEHNIQYYKHKNLHHILSGSGCKVQHLRAKGNALFSHKEKGWAKVNYYNTGEVWVEFWEPKGDGNTGELMFRYPLYAKKTQTIAELDLPARDFSDSVITLPANPDYEAGKTRSFWLGLHYRDEWVTPVKMPLLNLSTEQGGLTPYKTGGGKQTKSLKLRNEEGQLFQLRSVNKDPAKALPGDLRETVIKDVVQDQISAQHPYGSLIIPKLADAAGVLHTNPKLVFIPSDPALKRYIADFSNTIAFLEEDPNESQESVASLGYAQNLVGTEKVLQRLRDDNDNYVDEKEFARARLFDMLVGDWDRHQGQWRWKEQKTDKARIFTPVPEDRDVAFFKADGFIPYMVSRKWAIRNIQNFGYDYGDYIGLNLSALNNDRNFLSSVDREEWLAIATEMKNSISDAEIEEAVRDLPPEVYPLSGPEIAAKLKSRRDLLPKVAMDYYKVLAREVDIVGTDKHEKFEVKRLDNQRTEVIIHKITKQGTERGIIYQRTFHSRETKEIRLYGLDGRDIFEVTGKARKGIMVRIIGGNDPDSITDNSKVGGLKKKTVVYDTEKDNVFAFGSETKDNTEPFKEVNNLDRDTYKIPEFAPKLFLGYNEDDRVYIGGGIKYRNYRFRKTPFASEQTFAANYAPASGGFNIRYTGEFKQAVMDKYDIGVLAAYFGPQLLYNYFGIGNNTEFNQDNDIDFYRVRFSRFLFSPTLNSDLFSFFKVGIGPQIDLFKIDDKSGEYVLQEAVSPAYSEAQATPDDFQRNRFLGWRGFGDIESVTNEVNPRLGIRWLNNLSMNWQLDESGRRVTRYGSELVAYFSPTLPFQLTAAYRLGGAHNWGDYHFYQANTLGGTTNLRGYRRTRFAGRSALYQNVELRVEMFKFNFYLFPGRIGAVGLYDMGRVFADTDTNKKLLSDLHTGYGGGMWLEVMRKLVVVGTYSRGEEGLFNLTFGFLY
ncbi:metallophosphoesterase [Adhaeribacter terreus]|uniref:Metallophosphoesterase n=1 Tax=Adhaeribacter terreus TaxID=529703 RepID=A0ABW0EDW8_9BACT